MLALPGKPLLVEASITIAGQPFRMAREQRIQQLLTDLKRKPEAKAEAESTSDESESSENAEAEQSASDSSTDSKDNKASESEAPSDEAEDTEEESDEGDKPEVTPPSVPDYSLPSNVLERLRRQVKVTGEEISADELRWLLSNWVDGPNLLLLNDHFQRFRANQRPVFYILDRDRDGAVSANELAKAVASFEECDLNRNDIVDYAEIERSAEDPRRKVARHSGAGRLIFLLPYEQSASTTYARLAQACAANVGGDASTVPRFDADANGQFDPLELKALREATPDLAVTIAFVSDDPTKSKLTVEIPKAESDRQLPDVAVTGEVANEAVIVIIDGQLVELSAVQDGPSDQVSLGAVNDGYPLLAVIDPNDDGRFTIRERRTLTKQLATFDRNKDGTISSGEAQATIRVCFGLGATVHRELAELRRVDRKPQAPTEPCPGWFVRMDRNKDNDLSRQEFPGTDEQFAKLDADGDLLVSADEARNAQP